MAPLFKRSVSQFAWRALALACLAAFVVGLKVFPYKTLSRWMPRSGEAPAAPWRKRQLQSNIAWAAPFIPGATCLPQALTGYVFFAMLGLECRVKIGVTQSGGQGFRAHATLMSGDAVVVGDSPEWQDFVPLTELRPGR